MASKLVRIMKNIYVVLKRMDTADDWDPIMAFDTEPEADEFLERAMADNSVEIDESKDCIDDFFTIATVPVWSKR
jgi:hypothetical protein